MKVKCPKCQKLVEYEGNEFRPFCSKRCKIIDLGDWADQKYTVPTEQVLDDLVLSDKSENDFAEDED
jgi:endogenous inhibitor of DNA gyrase (YacG/DUF329 family)